MPTRLRRRSASSPSPVFKRVLLAAEPTPASRAATRLAAALARALRGEVHACYVVDPSQVNVPTGLPALVRAELAREGRRVLSRVAALCGRLDVPYDETLAEGPVARELAQTARRIRADVLVMGTLGRGRVRAFLLGSLAQEVVSRAPCPVLLVRHGGARRRTTRPRSRSRSPRR